VAARKPRKPGKEVNLMINRFDAQPSSPQQRAMGRVVLAANT
jgi:hypothetical protein